MNQEKLIEQIIKEVMMSMGSTETTNTEVKKENCVDNKCKINLETDYPLATKRPEWVKTPTGRSLNEITLKSILDGDITSKDVRIAPETLELQAQVAEAAGRAPLAQNFRRASELIAVPDDRILEIYNAMRPNRSTKQELLDIADELENKYDAKINADFVREAAEVYEKRNRLRQD